MDPTATDPTRLEVMREVVLFIIVAVWVLAVVFMYTFKDIYSPRHVMRVRGKLAELDPYTYKYIVRMGTGTENEGNPFLIIVIVSIVVMLVCTMTTIILLLTTAR